MLCIGSAAELEERAGATVAICTRTSAPRVDRTRTSLSAAAAAKGRMRRIAEVFDCWFESGCMPYAQNHYPFENGESCEQNLPADFIAEGLDQTRGWFYTLHVLSTRPVRRPAFKNVIVNGLILAADGKKMSKRLKNYPDPNDVIDAPRRTPSACSCSTPPQ